MMGSAKPVVAARGWQDHRPAISIEQLVGFETYREMHGLSTALRWQLNTNKTTLWGRLVVRQQILYNHSGELTETASSW